MVQATWKGHTMYFSTAKQAQAWRRTLNSLYRRDEDAAYRVAYAGDDWRAAAKRERAKKNPSMKMPKLGKWISAAKVRLVKKNGVKVLEIRRTVKKRTTRTNKARKRKR